MRRRTARLELSLLLAAAAAVGCGPSQRRACVDGEGRRADDARCEHPGASDDWTASNGADAGAPVAAGGGYHWVYYPRPWYGWGFGWGGGGYGGPAPAGFHAGEGGVSRGGFGGTGAAHAAGAGHGGAAGHGAGA
ncbi:hypothetical protein [Anaeromyxobacter paludicola]|uniref:Lipoprotein n=1 Tax=Anaeromyxobacter paludicola TaxID=2918171 RepID=A0ABN6NC69_9BACT|nr:hypothetical protein [Anaeromyxobacter paludicola]BDG09970.1 hypothetical protein AMPC_30830 [Anaeromyxobacter paludicola]